MKVMQLTDKKLSISSLLENIPENPPTAQILSSTTATATFALHVVIVGPGFQTFSCTSSTSVVHNEWDPSEPPTTTKWPI